jgi:hypothetical protein
VAEGSTPRVFEGDAWLLRDNAAEMEDALGVTVDDGSAVVVPVCHQPCAPQCTEGDVPS